MSTMSKKNKVGRPPSVTTKEVSKLEQAFAIGASVKEARNYAKITKSSYYRFLEENPEYRERFEELRTSPILKALQTLYNDLDDPDSAKWLLERRRKNEYSPRQEVGGEVRVNLWQQFVKKANQDAPRYLGNGRGNSKKAT